MKMNKQVIISLFRKDKMMIKFYLSKRSFVKYALKLSNKWKEIVKNTTLILIKRANVQKIKIRKKTSNEQKN